MPNFSRALQWTIQPPSFTGLDTESMLYPYVESVVAIPSTQLYTPLYSWNWNLRYWHANNQANAMYPVGSPTFSNTSQGQGAIYSSTQYVQGASQATSAPWTLAAIICPTNSISTATDWIGCNNGAGTTTHDRSISSMVATGNWAGYVYDGASQYADSGIVPVVGRTDTIVVWATSSVVGVNVNGIEVTKSTSNSGYTGYSTPQLFIGDASNLTPFPFICPLCIRSNIAWSPGQRSAFIANPWQIFAKQPRTFLTYPTAAPVITGLSAIGASSGGFGGGYGIGAAGAAGD